MRKKMKKLSLSRETLAHLESTVLGDAAGGGPKQPFATQNITGPCCDITLSCPSLCEFRCETTGIIVV